MSASVHKLKVAGVCALLATVAALFGVGMAMVSDPSPVRAEPSDTTVLQSSKLTWKVPPSREEAVRSAMVILLATCPRIGDAKANIDAVGVEYRDLTAFGIQRSGENAHKVIVSFHFVTAPSLARRAWTHDNETAFFDLVDGPTPGIVTFKLSGRWLCGLNLPTPGEYTEGFIPVAAMQIITPPTSPAPASPLPNARPRAPH